MGLLLAAVRLLHWLTDDHNPSTSDEYIRNFHDPSHPLDLRPVLGRMVASVATLGSGGALGFEGPSIYVGAAIGTGLQARFRRLFVLTDVKVLMVAGAAAGVSAIFKTPATGAIFAVAGPVRDHGEAHAPPGPGRFGDGLPGLRGDLRDRAPLPGRRVTAVLYVSSPVPRSACSPGWVPGGLPG